MLYHFDEAAIYIISALILLLIILAFKKRSFSYLLFFLIFSVYIINVINLVIFPIWIPGPEAPAFIERFPWGINLIPFYFGRCDLGNICQEQIFQNILLTIPFGFGICFIAPLKARDFRWLPLAVGLGFEISQFIISQGGMHSFDINDILLNATGVILGYTCFRIFGWLYRGAIHRLRINPRWVFEYMYEVVSH